MNQFKGQSVENITLKKQSDVVISKLIGIQAAVSVPEGTEILQAGQVLITTDGGKNFDKASKDAQANGILCESIKASQEAEVLIVGIVRQNQLEGLDETHKPHLFENKIILK